MADPIDILVVDDQQINRLVLTNALRDQDLAVHAADSGEEALRLMADMDFALILLDVMMPGMDGYETARRIMADARNRSVPIIFFSGVSDRPDDIRLGYQTGAVDYLLKPIEPGMLSAKVKVFADLYRERKRFEACSTDLQRSMDRLKATKERLRLEREFLWTAMEHLPLGAMVFGPDGATRYLNRQFSEITGFGPADAPDLEAWLALAWPEPGEREAARAAWAQDAARGASAREIRMRRRDGKPLLAEQHAAFLADGRAVVTLFDVTERRRAEDRVREEESRFRSLVSNIPGVMYRKGYGDRCGAYYVSDTIEELTGRPAAAFLGESGLGCEDLILDEDRDMVRRAIQIGVAERKPYMVEYRIRRADGEVRWVYEKGQAVFDGSEEVRWLDGAIFDVTERKAAEEELIESRKRYMELSIRDELTGLYNFRHFFQQLTTELERAARYGRSLSLILLDIDDFKAYNDGHGHLEGDKVLSELGRFVQKTVRATDSGYRYGGEEFVVILPETPGREALNLAERLRTGFARLRFRPGGEEQRKTVSVGVSQFRHGETMASFIERTDRNMYQAKRLGKNITVLDGEPFLS